MNNIYKAERFKYINDNFSPSHAIFFKSKNSLKVESYIKILIGKVDDLKIYTDYHYKVFDYINHENINIIWRINKLSKDDITEYEDFIKDSLVLV